MACFTIRNTEAQDEDMQSMRLVGIGLRQEAGLWLQGAHRELLSCFPQDIAGCPLLGLAPGSPAELTIRPGKRRLCHHLVLQKRSMPLPCPAGAAGSLRVP